MSSIAFTIGMLIVYLLASDPSATIQLPPLCTPHSLSRTDSSTPVHSLQLVRPCTSCTESPLGPRSGRLFALHSRKYTFETDGNRLISSIVNVRGRSTMPCIN